MSKNDFIYCEKGVLPKDVCKKIIDFFDKNMGMASPGRYTRNVGSIDNLEIPVDISNPDGNYGIRRYVQNGMFNYKKRYPLIDTCLRPWDCYHECLLMKYEPDKYYDKIHCENDCYNRPSVERVFGWMIYLNDIRRGGGTEFLHQRFTAKPRAGDLYIWPAGWTHMHRGVNAPKEVKYIITGWINFT